MWCPEKCACVTPDSFSIGGYVPRLLSRRILITTASNAHIYHKHIGLNSTSFYIFRLFCQRNISKHNTGAITQKSCFSHLSKKQLFLTCLAASYSHANRTLVCMCCAMDGAFLTCLPPSWLSPVFLDNSQSAGNSPFSSHSLGDVLLSQGDSPQLPSALKSLTSVFGMDTGVASSPSSPNCCGFR